MPKKVGLTIDGKEVRAGEEMNLIEASALAGIHIPNLCYLKGMKGMGACRLCLVDIAGQKAPVTACTTKVKKGMVVQTQTEEIQEVRRYVIDLILSIHPLDCMTCTKAGVCRLQKYAYDFGIQESSFKRKSFDFRVDEENDFIRRDPNYCVLCGRCAQVCKEQGTSVLDFNGRGIGARVVTADDRPLQDSGCTFCGSCIDACPVNALLEADRWRRGREWDCERVNSACLACGCACSTVVSVKDGGVVKVNIGAEEGRADYFICQYGRFGAPGETSGNRIKAPMKRADGELVEIGWEEAISIASQRLGSPAEVGVLVSGNLMNEDVLTVAEFCRKAGIDNSATTAGVGPGGASDGGHEADMEEADLIVLVGVRASQREKVLAALDATVRKRVARGAKLVVIGSGEAETGEVANVYLKGDEAATLAALSEALGGREAEGGDACVGPGKGASEDIVAAASLISEAVSPLVIASPELYEASSGITPENGRIVPAAKEANSRGTLAMGIERSGASPAGMVEGGARVLYVLGAIETGRPEGIDFLIMQSPYLTGAAKEADLLLPSATSLEAEGSIFDYMGRLKTLEMAAKPCCHSRGHREIVAAIARKTGIELKPARFSDVKKRLKASVAK